VFFEGEVRDALSVFFFLLFLYFSVWMAWRRRHDDESNPLGAIFLVIVAGLATLMAGYAGVDLIRDPLYAATDARVDRVVDVRIVDKASELQVTVVNTGPAPLHSVKLRFRSDRCDGAAPYREVDSREVLFSIPAVVPGMSATVVKQARIGDNNPPLRGSIDRYVRIETVNGRYVHPPGKVKRYTPCRRGNCLLSGPRLIEEEHPWQRVERLASAVTRPST